MDGIMMDWNKKNEDGTVAWPMAHPLAGNKWTNAELKSLLKRGVRELQINKIVRIIAASQQEVSEKTGLQPTFTMHRTN